MLTNIELQSTEIKDWNLDKVNFNSFVKIKCKEK